MLGCGEAEWEDAAFGLGSAYSILLGACLFMTIRDIEKEMIRSPLKDALSMWEVRRLD
jgi:hypothetical protein